MEPSATPQRCDRRKERKVDGERCDIHFRRTLMRYEAHALVLEALDEFVKDVKTECMESHKSYDISSASGGPQTHLNQSL